jgi:hypothetical protein
MADMPRFFAAVGVAVMLAVLLPAVAGAQVIELGPQANTPLVAPTCPKGANANACTIILTRVTALETLWNGAAYPTKVTKAGNIVAFTLGLSALDSNRTTVHNDIHNLDSKYGGTTRAAITVLKPVGPASQRQWTVVASSPVYHLQPYLGQVVQFPLNTAIPVIPGEVVALSVPTWAPVLSIQQSTSKFAYRQSRSANCSNPPATPQVFTLPGGSAKYGCDYAGTRVEYSVTEITTPVAVNPVHGRRRPAR